MELRQIQCFICLYEERSVTRAASQLGIVQPALSMQIAKLEKELGVKLFHRGSRGVSPTGEGTTLYRLVLPVTREFENIRRTMLDLGGRASGIVRLGIAPSLTTAIVPAALAQYCDLAPEVTVKITEAYSVVLAERVESGDLDFAIANDPPQPGGLIADPLVSEELVLVTSRASGLVAPGPLDCERLHGLPLILPTAGQGRLRIPVEHGAATKRPPDQPRLEMDAVAPALELVKSGRWATILPVVAIVPELERGLLQINRLQRPAMIRHLVLLRHPRRPLSRAGQLLFETIAAELRKSLARATSALAAAEKLSPGVPPATENALPGPRPAPATRKPRLRRSPR